MHTESQRSSRSIGVFDSGVGGLTVMKQLTKILPKENIVYFGDTARLPYGGKSAETIIRYSIENSIFLMGHDVKLLVVACHTASSCALDRLQQIFNIPVIGTIFPAIEKAVELTQNGHIAILGTKATVNSGIYQRAITERLPQAKVTAIACPLLVPLIEENFILHPATKLVVKEYLQILEGKEVDTLILGCTHYPLLRSLIAEELNSNTAIVDSALVCAEAVNVLLGGSRLRNDQVELPTYKYFVSDDPEKFRSLGKVFLEMPLTYVEAATHST